MNFKQYMQWQYYFHLLIIEVILFLFMGYFLKLPQYITPGLNLNWIGLFVVFYIILLIADFVAHGIASLLGWSD